MNTNLITGILIPFAGTSLGAACVLFMKKGLNERIQRVLTGFAAGVMVAASIWSLLLPAIEQSESMGKLSFFPAVVGFWIGILFLLLLDHIIPHLHMNSTSAEGPQTNLGKSAMMVLAVVLHNIPEGMAVGVVYAGWNAGNSGITLTGALALSIGIAIQNLPEGAIISMPLHAEGMSKRKAFIYGVLSYFVEPVGAIITIFSRRCYYTGTTIFIESALSHDICCRGEELIPEMFAGEHSNIGTIMFAVGFTVMMMLTLQLGWKNR